VLLAISYALGCLWFMFSTGASLEATLAACVLPFLIPDAIKTVVAFGCAQALRAAL
jgi:biotin transport system substrate-specific component